MKERIEKHVVVVEDGDSFELECTMFDAFEIAEMLVDGKSFEVFFNGMKCTSREDNENLFNYLVEKYGNSDNVINLLEDDDD